MPSPYLKDLKRHNSKVQSTVPDDATLASSLSSCKPLQERFYRPLTKEDLATLATMFFPLPEFFGKVKLDLNRMDLLWLFKKPIENPSQFVSLENFVELHEAAVRRGRDPPPLNSPRSCVTLLRNGLSVDSLIPKTVEQYKLEGSLEGVPKRIVPQRMELRESKRHKVLQQLLDEYRAYSQMTTLDTVLEFFTQYNHDNPAFVPDVEVEQLIDGVQPLGVTSSLGNTAGKAGRKKHKRKHEQQAVDTNDIQLREVELGETSGIVLQTGLLADENDDEGTPFEQEDDDPGGTHANIPPEMRNIRRTIIPITPPLTDMPKGTLSLGSPLSKSNKSTVVSHVKSLGASNTLTRSLKSVDSTAVGKWEGTIAKAMKKVDDQLQVDLTIIERGANIRKNKLQQSVTRELVHAQRYHSKVREREDYIKERSSLQNHNLASHKVVLRKHLEHEEQRKLDNFNMKESERQQREEICKILNEHKRTVAAKHKERRLERRLRAEEKNLQAEIEKECEFYQREQLREMRRLEVELQKAEEMKVRKQQALEKEQQRILARQKSELLHTNKTLTAEEQQFKQQLRVEEFLLSKEKQERNRKDYEAVQREKREKVYNAAKDLQLGHVQAALHKEGAFNERWEKHQQGKQLKVEDHTEAQRQKAVEKHEANVRAKNMNEWQKAKTIDLIQRKVDKSKREQHAKDTILEALKFEYQERRKDCSLLVAEMANLQLQNERNTTYNLVNQGLANLSG